MLLVCVRMQHAGCSYVLFVCIKREYVMRVSVCVFITPMHVHHERACSFGKCCVRVFVNGPCAYKHGWFVCVSPVQYSVKRSFVCVCVYAATQCMC